MGACNWMQSLLLLQFVTTLETNIFAKINALVNVTITKVVQGSVSVTNSAAFTGSNSAEALAGQSALADVLNSGDVSSIFGDSFGTVTVSGVTKGNATNPSECCYTLWQTSCAVSTSGLPCQSRHSFALLTVAHIVATHICLTSGTACVSIDLCHCWQCSCHMCSRTSSSIAQTRQLQDLHFLH